MIHHDASIELARTAALNAMIIGQAFYLVNSRLFFQSCLSLKAFTGNRLIPAAIGGVILLQILFTYAPFMNDIFGSVPLFLALWKWLLLGGVVFCFLVELEKVLVRLLYAKGENAEG